MPKASPSPTGPRSPKRPRLAPPPRQPDSAHASASTGSSSTSSPRTTVSPSAQGFSAQASSQHLGPNHPSGTPSRAASSSTASSPVRRTATDSAGGNGAGSGTNGNRSSATPRSVSDTRSDPPSERRSETGDADVSDDERKRLEARKRELSLLVLDVCQQPERARLCSFKEENETIDRRPVDPPPVIELRSHAGEVPDLMDSTSFFIRASLVAAEPSSNPERGELYATVKTPTGADATAGEVIQTPERLRHLDGKPGALCIFAKLSVRLPGVFRLKFTLYETAQDGITEITHVVSEPFEVFSPKLFKGMHESTPLTRHLATQGLKVKLRTDSSGGKGTAKRRASVASYNAAGHRNDPGSPATRLAPGMRYNSLPAAGGPNSAPPYANQRRNLVWHPHHSAAAYRDYETRSLSDEPHRYNRRHHDGGDDGMFALTDISSRLDFGREQTNHRLRRDTDNNNYSVSSPSSDLSAFSLARGGRPASASGPPRWVPREYGQPGDDGFPSMPPHQHRPHTAGPISHGGPPGMGPAHHSPPGPPPPEFALPRLPRIVPVGPMDPRMGGGPGAPMDGPPMHAHPHYAPHHDPRDAQDPRDPRDPRDNPHHARDAMWHGPAYGGPPPPPPQPPHLGHAGSPPPILPPIIRARSPPRPYERDPRG